MLLFLSLIIGLVVTWIVKVSFLDKRESELDVQESKNGNIFILETEETITVQEAEKRGEENYYEGKEFTIYVDLDAQGKSEVLAEKDLRNSEKYEMLDLSDEQIEFLSSTKILGDFDDWSFEDSRRILFKKGHFIPAQVTVGFSGHHNFASHYEKNVFWLKTKPMNCHYYFSLKSSTEKFFDKVINDDKIYFEQYECHENYSKSSSEYLRKFLMPIVALNPLDFEVLEDNVFFSFERLNRELVQKIETVLEKI